MTLIRSMVVIDQGAVIEMQGRIYDVIWKAWVTTGGEPRVLKLSMQHLGFWGNLCWASIHMESNSRKHTVIFTSGGRPRREESMVRIMSAYERLKDVLPGIKQDVVFV